MDEIGSWVECLNPFHNPVKHSFFRYTPKSKYFNRNDVAKICPICWYEAKKRNGTLPISNTFKTLKNIDSKPEKDSL